MTCRHGFNPGPNTVPVPGLSGGVLWVRPSCPACMDEERACMDAERDARAHVVPDETLPGVMWLVDADGRTP